MTKDVPEPAAFSCCSAGIGRWFWVAWASESDARADAPIVASGFGKNAEDAARKAVSTLGPETRQLPTRWASSHRKRGSPSARAADSSATRDRPKSRLSRPVGAAGKGPARLAFLYSASESDRPGEVAVFRHRIVRQTATKLHVDREPFRDEDSAEQDEAASNAPKPRTLAVDRDALRREGKVPHHRGSFFYATEDAGIRDIHSSLTSKHPWCVTLGLKFPCSSESVKNAYRRLARATHPDAGGVAAEFRAVEQAYRDALAYFTPIDGAIARLEHQ